MRHVFELEQGENARVVEVKHIILIHIYDMIKFKGGAMLHHGKINQVYHADCLPY